MVVAVDGVLHNGFGHGEKIKTDTKDSESHSKPPLVSDPEHAVKLAPTGLLLQIPVEFVRPVFRWLMRIWRPIGGIHTSEAVPMPYLAPQRNFPMSVPQMQTVGRLLERRAGGNS